MSLVDEAWMSQAFGMKTASEPWADNATLFQPLEEQVLIGDNAAALAVQALLRMCNLNAKVETVPNAEHMSPSGKMPVLYCGKFFISELMPIVNFIKRKGVSLSEKLNDTEKHDLVCYMDLINNVIVPAELFVTWLHEETWKMITSKRYGQPYPWPLNYFVCWKKQFEVKNYLNSMGWGKSQSSLARAEEEVNRCCQALSQKLGSKPYFFGQSPTELDALVFGHLYTLLTTKLPDNRVAETVKSFDNLVKFCDRIDKTYFSKECEDEGTQSGGDN